ADADARHRHRWRGPAGRGLGPLRGDGAVVHSPYRALTLLGGDRWLVMGDRFRPPTTNHPPPTTFRYARRYPGVGRLRNRAIARLWRREARPRHDRAVRAERAH